MSNKKLNIYYQNCGGIRSKLVEVRLNIYNSSYDAIILTETWLRPGILDSEIVDCDHYLIYRRDRDLSNSIKKDGGGVLVAIKKSIPASRLAHLELPNLEELIITIPLENDTLFISAIYIPPKSSRDTYTDFYNHLEYITTNNNIGNICVIGDFNLPQLNWQAAEANININIDISQPLDETCKQLANTMSFLNAHQYNSHYNCNHKLLDLLICNKECPTSVPDTLVSNIDRHHPPFQFTININNKPPLKKQPIIYHNYYKADYEAIAKDLSAIDWSKELHSRSVEEAVDYFYKILYQTIDLNVPLKKKYCKYPCWFSKGLISALKRKQKMLAKWKNYSSLRDYNEFALLRTRCKTLLRKCYITYTKNTENSLKSNIKSFWAYIASFKETKPCYPATMSYEHATVTSPADIAELFSKFFSSVFEKSDNIAAIDLDSLPCSSSSHILSSLYITEKDTNKKLNQLDCNKGAGADNIGPLFLKKLHSHITKPLTILFNKCIEEGNFPNKWKLALIMPLHKSGAKSIISNYRPISKLSIIPKIFESLVHDVVYPHVESSIIQQQHGFMKKKSTLTNLMLYSNFIFESVDQRTQVDAIYTDFRKAFDKVDHLLMLKKLAFNGIKGNLLRWFASYLSKRTQKIMIAGHESSTAEVTSGVFQGSVLGPLLYILFINDISQCFIHSKFLMFADDLKIYRQVIDHHDTILMQNDLDRFNNYCSRNKLSLAYDKCVHITFTRNRNKIMSNYHIGNATIKNVPAVKDLGILFDEKLIFDQHIDHITTKAYRALGFVLRAAKPFRKASSYTILYKALIRPNLEYASNIWNPYYDIYSQKIELIQKKILRATHFRTLQGKIPYKDLLTNYNLTRLSDRRTALDMTTLYRICNDLFNSPELLERINFRAPSFRTRSQELFASNKCRTNAGRRAPLNRLMETYNKNFVSVDIIGVEPAKYKRNIYNSLQTIQD